MTMTVNVELAPYQNQVLQSQVQFILMHGGRGSGKSHTLIMDLYNFACTYPKSAIALVCNDLVQLRTSTHETLIRYLDLIGCPFQYNKVEKILTFPNGCTVHELTFEKDKTSLKGAEWDAIYVDEADGRNTTEEKLDYLIDSCRGKHGDRRVRVACNPVPPGHFLAKRFLVNPRPNHHGYKVSTYMNEVNLPSDYIPNLEAKYVKGTDDWKRWMMGEMITLQGAVYKEFNEENLIEPHLIPSSINAWCYGVDLGVHDPMVILEGGVDSMGTLYITQMYYRAGLDITQHIPLFEDMIKPDWPMFVDHSATQHSIMQTAGFNTTNAYKDVEEGIQLVSTRFIQNSIKISTDCQKLIEELYVYCWKPSATGREVPEHKFSHSPDALRYLICGLDKESMFDQMEW